jgi:Fe-S oxidoreductase
MNPNIMLTLLVAAWAAFAWSANRRWQLLKVGRGEDRLDRIGERLGRVFKYAVVQKKMGYYPLAGFAHKLIFAGFIVLLLRSLILWGRGFSPGFSLGIFGETPVSIPGLGLVPIGPLYGFLKDSFACLVLAGALVFVYYRVINPQRRMSLHPEGLGILVIIMTMMIADMVYDGASLALHDRYAGFGCEGASGGDIGDLCAEARIILTPYADLPTNGVHWALWPSPAGSFFAVVFQSFGLKSLVWLATIGFWTHSSLVLFFLNLLPHSKHFHIITALPNAFTSDLTPPGRMKPLAESSEKLMELVGAAAEKTDPLEAPIGVARIEHFTWKAILDFYTCTECGRCSDHCPAHRTGKILSPKHLTLDLRDHLYGREVEFLYRPGGPAGNRDGNGTSADGHATPAEGQSSSANGDRAHAEHDHAHADDGVEGNGEHHAPAYPNNPNPLPDVVSHPVDLVPNVIHPDVLWGCTTCRACEEQCPVLISYVDKITDMRRSLVLIRGEFPPELQKPFQGMEVNGNPWNLARVDRADWATGLGIPSLADHPKAPVLFWVGCSASYDDRAKRIARATAKLLKAAGVEFAILGQEETCTGDPARRAGNEYLFAMLAEQNVATLNGYREQGGARTIVTTCPHCFNTLANEYPDFGGRYEVVHHTDFLLGLVLEKRLHPRKRVEAKVVFHDSCYLGRYNGIYEPPREILRRIPGVTLVEASMSKSTGLCCGAGGAQMWMEEQNKDRMNVRRTLQLVETQAQVIASGCPFCMTMLTDGLKSQSLEGSIRQLDVAEMLEESCALDQPVGVRAAMPQDPPRAAPSAAS